MNITSRRMIASLIDYGVIAFVLIILGFLDIPQWFWSFRSTIGKIPYSIPSIGFGILFMLVVFKDCVFKNASLGKRALGLRIMKLDDSTPEIKRMLKRGFFMPSVGYAKFVLSKLSYDELGKWEAEHIGTKVVCVRLQSE